MKTYIFARGEWQGRKRQRGLISTLIAIIVLVVTLLAAIALMRSIDTSNTIAGNLAFRQGVLQEAERAYKAATLIDFSEPTSDNNNAPIGYYATLQPATIRLNKDIPDVLMNKTAGSIAQLPSIGTNGNIVSYVVERLCPTTGPADPKTCIVPGATIQGGSSSNQTKDNGPPFSSGAFAAYRLTVRVDGPQNTVGYVQTVLR